MSKYLKKSLEILHLAILNCMDPVAQICIGSNAKCIRGVTTNLIFSIFLKTPKDLVEEYLHIFQIVNTHVNFPPKH